MIHQIAKCPFCEQCVAFESDSEKIVFNPDTNNRTACEHLVFVEADFTLFKLQRDGTDPAERTGGEAWSCPALNELDPDGSEFSDYLCELGHRDGAWECAPIGTNVKCLTLR